MLEKFGASSPRGVERRMNMRNLLLSITLVLMTSAGVNAQDPSLQAAQQAAQIANQAAQQANEQAMRDAQLANQQAMRQAQQQCDGMPALQCLHAFHFREVRHLSPHTFGGDKR